MFPHIPLSIKKRKAHTQPQGLAFPRAEELASLTSGIGRLILLPCWMVVGNILAAWKRTGRWCLFLAAGLEGLG